MVECSNTTHMSFGDFMFVVSFPLFTIIIVQCCMDFIDVVVVVVVVVVSHAVIFHAMCIYLHCMPNIRFFITTLLAGS